MDILYSISNITKNNIVYLGGYAIAIDNDIEYNKDEIDFYISSKNQLYLEKLNLTKTENNFPYPVLERYIGLYNDYFLDVFVSDRIPIYKIKNGLKYTTIEDDIEYFNLMYKNSNNQYFLNKLNENLKRFSRFI
jgi:hypothetical protein